MPPGRSGLYGTSLVVLAILLAVFWSVHPVMLWALMAALAIVSLLYYQSLAKSEKDRYAQSDGKRAPVEAPRKTEARMAPPQEKSAPRKFVPVFSPERKTQILSLAVFIFVVVIFLGIITLLALRPGWETPATGPVLYRQTLAANPDDQTALTELGNYYYNLLEYDSALHYYDRVLRIDPRNSPALYNKGVCHYKLNQFETSLSVLRTCIDVDPNNLDALVVLGHNYYDRQMYDQAEKGYRKAYDLGVRDAFLCHALGWIYDQRSETTSALAFYKEALSMDSTRADIYLRLAEWEPQRADEYQILEERWKQKQ